jgi:hypothetical protein
VSKHYRTSKFWHKVEYSIGGQAQLWSKGSEQQAIFYLADDLDTIKQLAPTSRELAPHEVAAVVVNRFLLGGAL